MNIDIVIFVKCTAKGNSKDAKAYRIKSEDNKCVLERDYEQLKCTRHESPSDEMRKINTKALYSFPFVSDVKICVYVWLDVEVVAEGNPQSYA